MDTYPLHGGAFPPGRVAANAPERDRVCDPQAHTAPGPDELQIVLICGGRGTRLGALNPQRRPKAMFPINGLPLAEHLWRQFRELSGSPPIVVHSADDRSAVEWAAALEGKAILCAQRVPDGVANAVALARPHLTGPALVLLGDVVLAGAFPGPWPESPAVGVWPAGTDATTVNNFGVRVRDGYVDDLIEKPAPGSGLVCGIGAYLLSEEHLRVFRYAPRHPLTGEREITEALRELVRRGHRLRPLAFAGTYLNVNASADVIAASHLLPLPRSAAA